MIVPWDSPLHGRIHEVETLISSTSLMLGVWSSRIPWTLGTRITRIMSKGIFGRWHSRKKLAICRCHVDFQDSLSLWVNDSCWGSKETITFQKEIKFQIDVALREACAAVPWPGIMKVSLNVFLVDVLIMHDQSTI